ncbi:WD40 repeat protein [Runella defluvii]|uniref:WD40 repeat protein n=1 Tax=Runella defluvii TaxID=370973 RepID=A0A7W5ZQF0_9BACT|nr:WD40 repeat domain-containing protein [Runella defluvii]MBB3841041.1 WD40 repeat protein [Runella defluvii]
MKTLVYFMLYLGWVSSSHAQNCPDYPRLLKEGNELRAKGQYRPALNKYNAAKLCAPTKSTEIDKLIAGVFDDIEKKKEEAEKQRDLAQKSTIEAQRQSRIAQEKTNDATALYWASEADKFVPKNAMRMLEAAAKKQTSTKTLNLIKAKTLSLFNQSNTTQFQETHSIPFDEYVTPQVSPDSKWLVLRNNEAFTVYNLLKKSLLRRFSETISDTDFSQNSQWFIAEKDTIIDIYSTEKWECFTTLQTKRGRKFTTFSPDEKWLLIDHRDGTFFVFNTSTWLKNVDFDAYTEIKSIDFSPDGKWLSIEVEKNKFKIVSLNSGKELVIGPDSMFTNVEFSPDGKWLSIKVEKNKFKIVSLNSGEELNIGSDPTYNSIEFSPDSKWIVTTEKDSLFKIYELSTGQEMLLSANYAIEFVKFSTDGKLIFIQSNIGSEVYKTDNLEYGILSIITNNVSKAIFSPDNQHLALLGKDKLPKIYELLSGKYLPFYFKDKIQDIRWSPNSDLLITKNEKGIVAIYDSKSIYEIEPPKKRNGIGRIELHGLDRYDDWPEIKFSQNGRWVSIFTHYNDENKYLILDCDKKEFNTYLLDAEPVFFSNSKEQLLFCQDKTLRILNLETNSISKFIEQENVSMVNSYVGVLFNKWIVTSGLTDVNFNNISNGFVPSFLKFKSIFGYSASNDKKWLGIRTLYGVLEIFNLETELKYNIIPKNEKVDLMGFAPNSQLFFSYINDTIRIRQIKDGKIIGTYNIGKNIENIEFLPDNQWLLVQIKDGTGLIYDIETGQTPQLLQEESRSKKDTLTWFISFQPDGNKTIVFKPDGRKTMIQKQDWEDFFKKILFDTTLQYNKNTTFLVIAKYDSTLEIENFSLTDLYKLGFEVDYCFFSNDSKWVYLTKDWGGVLENGKFNTIPDFLKNENKIIMTYFSPDSQWMLIEKLDGTNKIFNLGTKKPYNFLPKDKDIGLAKFSQNSQYITTVSNHKVITYELATGKPIQTLWVNTKPKQIEIIDNRYLFVVVGKAILKMDLQTQRGNFFSYGDGEPLDYTYEEIVEWMKVFGDEYLGPLSEEVKEKYGVK